MNHYRQYGPLDDQPELVGDAGFTHLDMLTDPALLPAGALALSENLRFDANGTTVRWGVARQFPSGFLTSKILGTTVFKPAADENYLLLATANSLVVFNLTTQTGAFVVYPAGETIGEDDRVDLVQAGVGSGTLPRVFILRGTGKPVLQYDANTGAITVATGFEPGDFALFYQDRIAVATAQDVHVSDFLDFTQFSLLNQFQILKGGDDYLMAFLPYQKDYVLIGTRRKWFIAYFDPTVGTGGYSGALKDTSFLRQLTSQSGPVGPRAAIEALGNIWFITGGAIYAFQPQLDNELTVLGKPISAPIQPIMDRMCVSYARRACVERYGYRLYFALPISEELVPVTGVAITPKLLVGLRLPFYLPAWLSTSSIATITTAAAHGLASGDQVLLAGSAQAGLNGTFVVFSVTDDLNFTVRLNVDATAAAGDRMTVQKLATRNNCVAVYNLNNQGWESIDWLPEGIYADWLLNVEHGAQQRLLLVDEDNGPMLYEEAEADEVGALAGGIRLPFRLPVNLSAANYASKPIPGRLRTRAYRWSSGGYARKVRGCEARATLADDAALTLILLARTPNNRVWTGTRAFTAGQFDTADAPLRKLCGERALEAQVEINTTGGRPTVRSILVETANVGKVEE